MPSTSKIVAITTLYEGWRKLLLVRLKTEHAEMERLVFMNGPAVAVLPYDPVRRTVIVVSQNRAPLTLAGEADMLEAIAGGVESGDLNRAGFAGGSNS